MSDGGNPVQGHKPDAPLNRLAGMARALRGWVGRHRRVLMLAAILVIAALAFEAVLATLAEVHVRDLRHAFRDIGRPRLGLALAFTAASYAALVLYDYLAVRTLGRRLPWRTVGLASFTSYSISNNLGLTLFTGGSARLRAYSAAGVDLADVARITLLTAATFWGGLLFITALALLRAAAPVTIGGWVFDPVLQRGAGLFLLAAIGSLFLIRLRLRSELSFGEVSLPLPSIRVMTAQLAVATVDLGLAAAALYVLIPDAPAGLFGSFLLAYALGILLVNVTHVPGGIGVFEATILALVPVDHGALFAALIVYRLVYYVLPMLLAGALLVGVEGHRLRAPIGAGLHVGLTAVERVGRALAPTLSALLVFLGGIVLLVSGAIPGVPHRLHALRGLVPLPFIETSHFVASLVGTALLLTAPALQARLRSGFIAARALLLAGALSSLVKGFDYEEAVVLLVVAGLLQYSRPAFYRGAGIGAAPFVRWWWAAALIAIAFSVWAGLLAYQHIPYSDDLWWDFAWRGNAPRFLRATLGATVLVGGWAFWRLMSAPPRIAERRELPADVAARAMAVTPRADAMLAYTGDKSFLVSKAGDAFLMYRVQGRSWITMGDPIGPAEAWPELVWELRRLSDAAHGRVCLFQVSADMLPLVVELGLQPIKYGDEAVVDLANGFTLAGPQFKSLRYSVKRATSAGLEFDILPAAAVRAHAAELSAVSDAWLARRTGAEKGFSLGRFDLDYLSHFECAVLRHEGRIVAFANLWATPNGEEMSVDLMRHLPDTPYGAMDLLFVRLLQTAAERGFDRFNLGLAPLSGLASGHLAPIWSRLGAAIYGHGERIYGFSGLRAFKNKFGPRWEPRYIGLTPGLSAPRALLDLAVLVGG